MKKLTLLTLGFPRTGTTSLWKFMRNHPQITVSNTKETIWEWDKNPETYLDFYNLKEDTKVIVDGTPTLTFKLWKKNHLENLRRVTLINRLCCLYTLRSDPIEKVKSYINVTLKSFYLSLLPWKNTREKKRWANNKPKFLDENGEFIEEPLYFLCRVCLDEYGIMKKAEEFFGKDNFFISYLSTFGDQQNNFWNFLDIDSNHKFDFIHYKNRIKFENTLDYLEYLKKMNQFNRWFDANINEFEEIKGKSCRKIERDYGFKFNNK